MTEPEPEPEPELTEDEELDDLVNRMMLEFFGISTEEYRTMVRAFLGNEQRKYRNRLDVKPRLIEYRKDYIKRPEVKERLRNYYQQPHIQAKMKALGKLYRARRLADPVRHEALRKKERAAFAKYYAQNRDTILAKQKVRYAKYIARKEERKNDASKEIQDNRRT